MNDALTFTGALLLNALVQHLEHATSDAAAVPASHPAQQQQQQQPFPDFPDWLPHPGTAGWGYALAAALALSAAAKALVGSHYGYGLACVTVR
jgi:hypothetical protein